MEKTWNRFNWFLALLGGLILAFIMVLAVVEICARLFFNSPIVGVTEILALLLPISLFLPLAYVEIADAHIRVDLFAARFSEKWQIVLDLIACLLGLILFGIIAGLGWKYAVDSWRSKEMMAGLLDLPVYPTKFAIAFGFTLGEAQLAVNFSRRVKRFFGYTDRLTGTG